MKVVFSIVAMAFVASMASAQVVDYNKIILPDNAQNVSFEERLVQLAWKNNPASHIAQYQLSVAREEGRLVGTEWTNAFAAAGNLNEFNIKSFTSENTVANQFFPRYNITLRLPLSLLVETPKKRNIANSKTAMAQESINLEKLEIRNTVLSLYSEFKKMELIWIIRKQTMEDEESAYTTLEQRFKDGDANIEEFLKAQRARNDLKIALAIAETDYVKAKLNLEQVIGVKLEDVK
ncbi:MAG TPA: TolC family protein [Cyclobacteriaceae bacterium]|nr:TolC family protein [Cyclobacteriaceae bacterium]